MQSPQATHLALLKRTIIVAGSNSKAPAGQTVMQAPQDVHLSSLRVTS
jgi:hypothetical protein